MSEEPIESRLIDFIESQLIFGDSRQIGADTELLLDGIIDSIGATRLVGFVEETWRIRVPPEDVTVENFGSIDQITQYLRTHETA